MDEFLTIPEPSRKQLEEKAIAYYDKLHSVGQFVSIDHVAPAFIAGHASRDAEVAQLKALLERAKPLLATLQAMDVTVSESTGTKFRHTASHEAEAWLADYERMEKGGGEMKHMGCACAAWCAECDEYYCQDCFCMCAEQTPEEKTDK